MDLHVLELSMEIVRKRGGDEERGGVWMLGRGSEVGFCAVAVGWVDGEGGVEGVC